MLSMLIDLYSYNQPNFGRIRISQFEKFCLWNPESWALESGKQLKESEIPLAIWIQNPSSADKLMVEYSTWNPESVT